MRKYIFRSKRVNQRHVGPSGTAQPQRQHKSIYKDYEGKGEFLFDRMKPQYLAYSSHFISREFK